MPPKPRSSTASRVTLERNGDGGWRLIRNGNPYTIKGVGGYTHLELLREMGGNTIRTWSIDQLEPTAGGPAVLDECNRLSLTAMVGIWVNQPRHGYDYSDQSMLQAQRDRVRAAVSRLRDHPALLIWGLGNEMESDGQDPLVWRELEVLAQIIKEEDPDHPVCSVLAGTGHQKIRAMQRHFTSLDLLGINSYADAENVDQELAHQGWNRPFLLTEFGPRGHWEVPATPWQAPLEPTPAEKVTTYSRSYDTAMCKGRGLCLGTFAFLWGQKQETTATWFSMFLPTGEKTPVVDAMARLWHGQTSRIPSPVIHALHASFRECSAPPNSEHQVRVDVSGDAHQPMQFEWQIVTESTDRKEGGDPEVAPPAIPHCIISGDTEVAVIRLPARSGAYRVFVNVRDGHGNGSSANFPFFVE